MTGRPYRGASAALLLVLALTACETLPPVDPGEAQVRVLLTGSVAALLDTMAVDLGSVVLVSATGDPDTTLTTDATDGLVDLISLRGRTPRTLAEVNVPPGDYSRLRLVIEGARLHLATGYAFSDVDGGTARDLTVPTGAGAGLELNLEVAGPDVDEVASGIRIPAGTTVLVLELDGPETITLEPDPDFADHFLGVEFSPAFRAVIRSVAGSIAGTVRATLSDASVDGLLVTARPLIPGALGAYQTESASTLTDRDGKYTLPYLVGGDYALTVLPDSGYTADPAVTGVTLGEGQDTTGVDFELLSGG